MLQNPLEKGTALTILLVIALVIATGFGAYYYAKNGQTELPNFNSTNSGQAPTLSLDETANWKTYKINQLNLEFKLPPKVKGEMKVETIPGESGNQLCASFPSNTSWLIKPVRAGGAGCSGEPIVFGTTSTDYMAGRGGGFTDLQGYTAEGGKYYAVMNLNRTAEIPMAYVNEVTSNYGVKALRVVGWDDKPTEGEFMGPTAGNPGVGKIGALVNTQNASYPGIAVVANLSTITQQEFDKILSTFKFIN